MHRRFATAASIRTKVQRRRGRLLGERCEIRFLYVILWWHGFEMFSLIRRSGALQEFPLARQRMSLPGADSEKRSGRTGLFQFQLWL